MKTIYFVRHGQSEGNVSDIIIGESAPLTARGKEQARFIAQRAAKLPLDLIVASTMVRAQETASYISDLTGMKYEESDLFRERRWPKSVFGKSKSNPAIEALLRKYYASFYGGGRVEDAENFDDLNSRGTAALRYLENRKEDNILVATHGFFLRMLLAQVLLGDTLTPAEFFKVGQAVKTENTGLSVFEYHPVEEERFDQYLHKGWRVRVWNDHAHLG